MLIGRCFSVQSLKGNHSSVILKSKMELLSLQFSIKRPIVQRSTSYEVSLSGRNGVHIDSCPGRAQPTSAAGAETISHCNF